MARTRRSAAEWRQLLGEWARSGLSQAEFCRRRGLRAVTLAWWKRRLRVPGRSGTVPRQAGESRETARFIELPPTAARFSAAALMAGGYEIVLVNGRRLRVGPDFQVDTLRQLIAALEEAAC